MLIKNPKSVTEISDFYTSYTWESIFSVVHIVFTDVTFIP